MIIKELGWVVSVGSVLNGPEEMGGRNVSYLSDFRESRRIPPGFIDTNIVEGDRVEVYGLLETIEPGVYDILLVGSKEYYIKPVYS
jgi:hypothetical protein